MPQSLSPGAALTATTESLSVRLKAHTSLIHSQVEGLLGLPAAICDRRDYEMWLGRFLGFYEPLESALSTVADSVLIGPIGRTHHAHRLIDDLRSLGIDDASVPRMIASRIPSFPTFAHAAGSRYVLMGATLGGRHILRGLTGGLKNELGTATRFLEGGGASTGSDWIAWRESLDAFGTRRPDLQTDVVAGAVTTFGAFHQWFVPFCDARSRSR